MLEEALPDCLVVFFPPELEATEEWLGSGDSSGIPPRVNLPEAEEPMEAGGEKLNEPTLLRRSGELMSELGVFFETLLRVDIECCSEPLEQSELDEPQRWLELSLSESSVFACGTSLVLMLGIEVAHGELVLREASGRLVMDGRAGHTSLAFLKYEADNRARLLGADGVVYPGLSRVPSGFASKFSRRQALTRVALALCLFNSSVMLRVWMKSDRKFGLFSRCESIVLLNRSKRGLTPSEALVVAPLLSAGPPPVFDDVDGVVRKGIECELLASAGELPSANGFKQLDPLVLLDSVSLSRNPDSNLLRNEFATRWLVRAVVVGEEAGAVILARFSGVLLRIDPAELTEITESFP